MQLLKRLSLESTLDRRGARPAPTLSLARLFSVRVHGIRA
jgi:hypothetical protein